MKPVLSALCILALIPVATLASDNAPAENSAHARCLAQAAEARMAKMRRDSSDRESVRRASDAGLGRGDDLRTSLASSVFVAYSLNNARTQLFRHSACDKLSGTQPVAMPRGSVTWKTGPR
jgi:hypothetical protein